MESAVKQMRLIWIFFLVAAVMYVLLPEVMIHPHVRPVQPVVYWVLLAIALMDLAVIVIMRKFTVGRAEDVLRQNPNDPAAIMRWRQGQLATLAIGSAIVLFGLVLRFIGVSTMQAVPFYVLGILTEIVFQPKPIQ